jgi:3-phosphoshikimate 1-carboxyvinyltransferase
MEERPTRDHTENMLSAMGVPVQRKGGEVTVSGGLRPTNIRVSVPGDVSSAFFFAAAASMSGGSEVCLPHVGINPTRIGALQILQQMGASVSFENVTTLNGEQIADLIVRSGKLSAVEVGGAIIPKLIDELPMIAVVATQAQGTTTVRGAGELRHKESDRIRSIVQNLSRLGADIEEQNDGFAVRGPSCLKGQAVSSNGDHRIAMAMAVAGLIADGSTTIRNSSVVGISYPGFFDDLRTLAA